MLTPPRAAGRRVPSPRALVRRARALGRGVPRVAVETWWRVQDYAYVVRWQADALLRPGSPDRYADRTDARPPPVLLIPGVYESWRFLRPMADALHGRGHAVHVLPGLGYNSGPLPEAAQLVGRHLAEHGLQGVVVVAHSKGGLIGKLTMLREDPDGRVAAMVAVNTPFAGSPYARWLPLRAVRAFVPTDATLLALAAERAVNARITSAYSRFDPHIPGGSELAGARNVRLRTPGHFRALTDPALERLVLEVLAAHGGAAPRAGAAELQP